MLSDTRGYLLIFILHHNPILLRSIDKMYSVYANTIWPREGPRDGSAGVAIITQDAFINAHYRIDHIAE